MDLITNSFASGELSPETAGRVDLPQYHQGCRSTQNMVVKLTGGATRRPGFEAILGAETTTTTVIPAVPATYKFTYISEDGHVWAVPVGDKTIAGLDAGAATNEGGGVVGLPYTGHPFVSGDTVAVSGTTNYDGEQTVQATTTANSIHIKPLLGYAAEVFAGTETVIKKIAMPAGGNGSMVLDADGNLYVGHMWDAVNSTAVTKIDTSDDSLSYTALNWTGSVCINHEAGRLAITPDGRYLFVEAGHLGGTISKFDLTTGECVWNGSQSARSLDIACDADGNAYARSIFGHVRKYDATTGIAGGTFMADPTDVVGWEVYNMVVDEDLGLVIAAGNSVVNVGDEDHLVNVTVQTLDGSTGAGIMVGSSWVDGPFSNSPLIASECLITHNNAIYVLLQYALPAVSKLYKLTWNGSALTLAASVDGPASGCGIYADIYGNIVVAKQEFGAAVNDVLQYYDDDLNYLGEVDSLSGSLVLTWDALLGGNYIRGTGICPGHLGIAGWTETRTTITSGSGELPVAGRLVAFVHKTDRYILAFCDHQMYVFKGGTTPTVVLSGGAVYHLDTPWGIEEVWDLVFAPRGQAIFHPDHDIYELVCDSDNDGDPDTDWTLTAFASTYGPFLAQNKDSDLTITPSATTGSITLTASDPVFQPTHVGALWKLTQPVDEVVLQGRFDNGATPATFVEEATSATVTIKGHYDIAVHWRGWGTLKLQRSADGGSTWQTLKTWINPDDDHLKLLSFPDGGEELEDDIQFRFTINWGTVVEQTNMYNNWELQWKLMWLLRPPYCQYAMRAIATSQTGIVRVTAYTSPLVVTATVLSALGTTDATAEWFEGAWSGYRGYPAKGTIHESRIYAARTEYQPTTVWAGRPFMRREDPRLFYEGSDVTDDDAFTRTIDSPACHLVEWLDSGWVLLMGTDGNLIKAIGASENTAMTPTQFNAMPQSGMGSSDLQPVQMGGHIVYTGRSGKRVYEMTYSNDARVYNPEDLTQYAEHITGSGVKDWTFMQQPLPILWAVTDDGELIGLTRDKQNNGLLAWHRHVTDGLFKSVAVIPSDGDDELWACIERDVNGTTKYYVERMKPFGPYSGGIEQADGFFVDSGVQWHGGATTTVTNAVAAPGTGVITVTAAGHGFSDGWTVRIVGVLGMTELNDHVYQVADKTDDTFTLKTIAGAYVNGLTYTAYAGSGTVERVANTLSGLTHLAAETVKVLGDGQPYDGSVSAAGVWTAGTDEADYFHKISIGRPYTHELEPMWPEVRTTSGTLQGKKKKVTHCTLRLYMSAGGDKGGYIDGVLQTQPIDYLHVNDTVGELVTLHTEDVPGDHPGGWTETGSIVITGDDPLPMTVSAILFGLE